MKKIISCLLVFILFFGCKTKTIEALPPESINIKVYILTSSGTVEKEVMVNSNDALLLLMKDLGIAHDYVIFYNGNRLNPYFSFDYYGIKDDDSILFIISDAIFENQSTRRKKWKGLNEERCRIRDIFQMKIDSNPRKYRRVLSQYEEFKDLPPNVDIMGMNLHFRSRHNVAINLIYERMSNMATNLDYKPEISTTKLRVPSLWYNND